MDIQTVVKLQSATKAYFDAYGTRYSSMVGKGRKNLPPSDYEIFDESLAYYSKTLKNFAMQMWGTGYSYNSSIGAGRVAGTPWCGVSRNEKVQIKASIVFFPSRDGHSLYATLDVTVADIRSLGVRSSFNAVMADFAARVRERVDLPIEHELPDIVNGDYANAAIYAFKVDLDNAEKALHDLTLLGKALEAYYELQTSDNPVMPNLGDDLPLVENSVPQSSDNQKTMNTPLQRIYFGTPGGGKSFKVRQVMLDATSGSELHIHRTTFHPDTDYASFVGSYKPVMRGTDITYEFVPQIFTEAYVDAWENPDEQIFLDIEEINRGNCAQIFGDLFQLLDRKKDGTSEYPIKADADLRQYLEMKQPNSIVNGNICLPANLNIVATMNTSDQSLFPMDSAFKRRWDWEFVPSNFNEKDNFTIRIADEQYKWHEFLAKVNDRIKEATDSEDKQMGSYFIKSDLDAEQFKSKVMFYLWSEICKEEYKTPNNFFRYNLNGEVVEFTFNELYADGWEAKLIGFMEYILTEK